MTDRYYFDDFFVADDDPGIEEIIQIDNKDIPVRIARAFTLQDIQSAQAKAVKTKRDLKTGETKIVSVDEQEFVIAVLKKAILSWPFTYRDGRPVPINEDTLRRIHASGANSLSRLVDRLVRGRQADLVPFESPSGEPS